MLSSDVKQLTNTLPPLINISLSLSVDLSVSLSVCVSSGHTLK